MNAIHRSEVPTKEGASNENTSLNLFGQVSDPLNICIGINGTTEIPIRKSANDIETRILFDGVRSTGYLKKRRRKIPFSAVVRTEIADMSIPTNVRQ